MVYFIIVVNNKPHERFVQK